MSISRREFLTTTAAASVLSLLPRSGVFAERAASFKKPNVLMLYSDQHLASLMSGCGYPGVQTPNLDKIAAEGVRFDRSYCPDGVCFPSRGSLVTGTYPRTHGLYCDIDIDSHPEILQNLTPIQRRFKQAGYYTFTAGKRHLAGLIDTDWDYSAGHLWHRNHFELNDTLNYWKWIEQKGLLAEIRADFAAEMGPTGFKPFSCQITQLPPEATMEAFTSAQTVQFLTSPQAKKQPFFAWSSFYRPHQPYTPLKMYADRIDPAKVVLPASFREPAENNPWPFANLRTRTPANLSAPWPVSTASEELWRTYIAYYIALTEEVDHHIGVILNTLEEQGLAENTIVLYTCDHGDFVGGHGMVGKACAEHNLYEETLRVPLLFRWPGQIQRGVVSQDLTETVDIHPTLLSLCGLAPTTSGIAPQGLNLDDTLRKGTPLGRKFVISESLYPNISQATAITDTHKYGHWMRPPQFKPALSTWKNYLFERKTDPHEMSNLCGAPTQAEKEAEMKGYIKDWMAKTDDVGRKMFFTSRKSEYPAEAFA